MQFTSALFALAGLTLAAANTVEFINQDSTTRHIVFTAQAGLAAIDDVVITGHGTANVTFPTSWIGNWYSYNDGAARVTGMLGEIAWNGYAGANYFDVSAIVNKHDTVGVQQIFPKNSNTPVAGCQTFPCKAAYYLPDDLATFSTTDDTLVCLVGPLSNERRRSAISRMDHSFVEA